MAKEGHHRLCAIALDTKGPEIRTGLLEGGASAEIQLDKDGSVTLTTKDEYKEKCAVGHLWLDYKNIAKVRWLWVSVSFLAQFPSVHQSANTVYDSVQSITAFYASLVRFEPQRALNNSRFV